MSIQTLIANEHHSLPSAIERRDYGLIAAVIDGWTPALHAYLDDTAIIGTPERRGIVGAFLAWIDALKADLMMLDHGPDRPARIRFIVKAVKRARGVATHDTADRVAAIP